MDPAAIADALRASALFGPLDDVVVADVARAATPRACAAGEVVFTEGDPGGDVFVVVAGALEALKQDDAGRAMLLRLLAPGEAGGLTSTILGEPRSATVRARGVSSLLVIGGDRFRDLLARHPALLRAVLAEFGRKVRGKNARLATLMAREGHGAGEPVAVFDAKPYDRRHLDAAAGDRLALRHFEARLGPETAVLATGCRVVCAFVNDDLGAAVLARLAAAGVELIALRCAGYNNVDLAAAAAHHLTVVRVPEYSPHAVAEHAAALILSLNRKIHRAAARVREGNFSLAGLVGFDLHGRTAGLIGLGKIGRCLAEILRGFGMTVLAHDVRPDPAFAERHGVRYAGLDDLLAQADVLSLHAPLTPATRHLLDAARIARLKPGVLVINTSRGGLIDTAALIDGLKSGRIGGAGLDVYEEESAYFFEDRSADVITDDVLARLLTFPNVLVTSHQAFLTDDALRNIAQTTVASITAYLAGWRGEDLPNVVTA